MNWTEMAIPKQFGPTTCTVTPLLRNAILCLIFFKYVRQIPKEHGKNIKTPFSLEWLFMAMFKSGRVGHLATLCKQKAKYFRLSFSFVYLNAKPTFICRQYCLKQAVTNEENGDKENRLVLASQNFSQMSTELPRCLPSLFVLRTLQTKCRRTL